MRGRVIVSVLLVAAFLIAGSGSVTPACALAVGDKAPAFELPATTKEKISLADYAGKNVLLFGFIGAFTPT